MKTFGIIFLFGILNLISCKSNQGKNNQGKNEVTKIEVLKVSFDILTIITIDCDNFENEWTTGLTPYIIESKDTIMLFMDIIDGLQKDTSCYIPDVRAKLLIYRENDQIDVLCMSKLGVLLNGESYLINKKLVKMIDDL